MQSVFSKIASGKIEYIHPKLLEISFLIET